MLTISSSVILWMSWLRLCCHSLLCARCSLMSVQLARWHWYRSKCVCRDRHLQKHKFEKRLLDHFESICIFVCLFVHIVPVEISSSCIILGIKVSTSVWSSLQQPGESLVGQKCQNKKWRHFHYQCWLGSDHLFPGWRRINTPAIDRFLKYFHYIFWIRD